MNLLSPSYFPKRRFASATRTWTRAAHCEQPLSAGDARGRAHAPAPRGTSKGELSSALALFQNISLCIFTFHVLLMYISSSSFQLPLEVSSCEPSSFSQALLLDNIGSKVRRDTRHRGSQHVL